MWGVKNGGRLGWKNSIKGTIGEEGGGRKVEENDSPLPIKETKLATSG